MNIKIILTTVIVLTLSGTAKGEVYTQKDRIFIGTSIPNISDRFKKPWFFDNRELEFRKHYRLPRQAEDAEYAGNGYLSFSLRGSCYFYNLENTFTFNVPCSAAN